MIEAKETIVGEISSNQNLRGEILPRGPKGDKGEKGDKGDKGDTGAKGADGKDGAIQYEAGENITIEGNVISAKGGGGASIYKMFKYNNPEKALVLNDLKCGDILVSNGAIAYITFLNNNATIIFNTEGTFLVSRVELIDGYAKYIKLFCIGGISYAQNFNRVQEITIRDEQTRIIVDGAREYYDMYTMVKQDKNSNISGVLTFNALPKSSVTPTDNNHLTRKGYVDALPTTYSGYDATKTQVLKNINGVLTWQDE